MTCIVHRMAWMVALPIAAAGPARAQDAHGGRHTATVSGVVYDSVARAPLAGATVQLAFADSLAAAVRSVVSDARGRFTLTGVPDGRYHIGFIHPMLDSMTIEPVVREVSVVGQRSMRVDLAIPSPARLRDAVCGPRASGDSSSVIVGVVRSASDGSRLSDVSVVADWFEVAFTQQGIRQRMPRRESMTGDVGWFALCDLPPTGRMSLRAWRGEDSTGVMTVDLPADGFARRDLYLGHPDPARGKTVLNAGRPPAR